jgi:hypothetical protein
MPVPVTVPAPVPDLDTVRVRWLMENVAVAVLLSVMNTVHELPLATLQPFQAVKSEPVFEAAVRVTEVPSL